ncbi:MAG: FliI/YscN family ATPase [Deltaproteobacteria bacterium]|nr:FliI/YscN family ATPase [Deltaproteobacteria bacterium]
MTNHPPPFDLSFYSQSVSEAKVLLLEGRVTKVVGLVLEGDGPAASVGELCHVFRHNEDKPMVAEVVGFREGRILLMPIGQMHGLTPGGRIVALGARATVKVGPGLLGRVLDGLGNPLDNNGPIQAEAAYPLQSKPGNPLDRERIVKPLDIGIRTINGLLTIGLGQRIGIFAGSGVGKSTLLSMIARNMKADVNVIGLIGERSREVLEFIQKDLGPEGMKRSVVIAATSEQPPLVRMRGAYVATAVAEYFRDLGKDVILMMDSATRFAYAAREVGLSIGEPATTRGYTPSVFAMLPLLLERAGTWAQAGSITGIYTVLVEGDDMNEPVADAMRAILDGHIVLRRELAARNHYPAIDVLSSVSRLMTDIVDREHLLASGRLKDIMAVFARSEDMINIGAYVKGSNKDIDRAIEMNPRVQSFLRQEFGENVTLAQTRQELIRLAG